MELLKNLEGLSADEQMTAVVELQKAAMKHLDEQKQASIGKSAELVIQGLKKIKSDFEAKFDSLNYDIQTKVASLKDGEQGLQGPKGDQGERGLDGANGRDGRDGKDGKDGLDGVDGVGVRDAKIDFDGSLVISLTDGREINCGEVVSVDVAKQIQKVTHNIQTGAGGDSQTVLDAIAAIQATIATYGTMATQNKTSVDIEGGTIDNTTIGATTPSTGVFTTLTATGQTSLGGAAGAETVRVLTGTNTGKYTVFEANTANNVQLIGAANSANLGLYSTGGGLVRFYTASALQAQQFVVSHTASAVNYVQVTGAATNNRPTASSQGSDTDIGFNIVTKGSGTHNFASDANIGTSQFQVTRTQASAVNYLTATGAATTFAPRLYAQGSDTNISAVFQSKGTGAIDLAAGSRGVNISNGGTVTAITRTNAGSGYTSFPTPAISAPTTAGGVQATATVTNMFAAGVTIAGGGTGYTAGNVLTVSGGTPQTAVQLTVSTVSAGVITGVTISTAGAYTALPTNPVSVTGGTGSGATFNLTWSVIGFTITNAGSGYVEQPTVTFSGGGGSGAAAYATVGSGTTVRSLGSTMSFVTPSSEVFRIVDASPSNQNYLSIESSGAGSVFRGAGTSVNPSIFYVVKGTGSHDFSTASGASTVQLRVSHTASAVNYVQVTGAGTTASPTLSSQGSDTNVNLAFSTKGTGELLFFTNGGSTRQFQVAHVASAVNRVEVKGAIAGGAPIVSSAGSDTNIPLVLQPKGTGALQAQQTDSTATGGNARGVNAVDWQTSRSAATAVASGSYSVVGGGSGNTASGFNASVVGGASNVASNNYAFVGGGLSNNAAFGMSGIVAGYSNQALGYLNLIAGGYANSGTSASTVTTQSATMNGTTAVTLSGSNANIKVGQLIIGTSINSFPYTYVAAISGTSLTLSQAASGSSTSTLYFYTPHGVVVGGGNNQAKGAYSFIGGGGDAGTAANRNVASGDWSTVAGGIRNSASGLGSFIGGGGTDGTTALGNVANTTSASVIGGANNIASGVYSVTGGRDNTADGNRSTAWGSNAWTRSIRGIIALSACQSPIGAAGVSQSCLLIIAKQTTDATATVLTSNGGAASTDNQVILPNNSAYYFRGEVVSGVTGGGNTKGWYIEGVIKRGANAASTALVGTPTVTSNYADAGASTWTIAVTADTTNGGLAVTFTGQAATTIRTVAQIRTTEMTY